MGTVGHVTPAAFNLLPNIQLVADQSIEKVFSLVVKDEAVALRTSVCRPCSQDKSAVCPSYQQSVDKHTRPWVGSNHQPFG